MDPDAIPWAALAPFVAAGFVAQLIDGTLGMTFGIVANALLVMLGLPPLTATAVTHSVESFTSGASGLSHAIHRNVDWPVFARLVIPGIVGGLIGVWLLSFITLDIARPVVLAYMAAIGVYLIWRAPRRAQAYRRMKAVRSLGLLGGVLDASGGGWGPIVTSNLLAQGMTPRMAIGTVNAAEFFVTVTVLAALIGTLGAEAFAIAASGLLIGGIAAAPLGAYLTKRISAGLLLKGAGTVLIGASFYGLASLMFGPTAAFPRF